MKGRVGMWRYDDLSIVIEVIRQGSFIKASKRLNIPSSTISRRVSEFESALGVRLLERNSRKLSLTDKGEALLEQCHAQMQQIKHSIDDISSNHFKAIGELKVTAPVTLGNELLNNWFCSFSKQYPDINLDIVLSNHYEDMLDDSFDVAIRVGPLKDSAFIGQLLFSTEMVLCANNEFLAQANIDYESVMDIANHHFLSFQQNKSILKLLSKELHSDIEIPVKTRMTSTSTAILRQAAVDGLGIACLPMISIQENIRTGQLTHIFKGVIGHHEKDIFAVYPSKKHLSVKTRVFLEYIKQQANSISVS